MDLSQLFEWASLGIISGGVYVLWQMKESVAELNTKMAVIVTTIQNAEKTIDDHEGRLRVLEQN